MTKRKASTSPDKQKILAAVVLLLVIGYFYGRPTLEKWLGRTAAGRADDFFTDLGRGVLESPAGLVYGMGPGGEHRVDHVMLHAVDDPSRPVHSVFEGSRDGILELIDEAWKLAQKGGRGVEKKTEGDRTEYTVSMNRPVGHEGGIAGKRNDFPTLRRIRLVIEGDDRLVTAYPFR